MFSDPSNKSADASAPSKSSFVTGAVRDFSSEGFEFSLLPPSVLLVLAGVYAEGAAKYGRDNYLKGIPFSNLFNHGVMHLLKWQMRDTSENHLSHALWNFITLLLFTQSERNDLDDRPDWEVSPEQFEAIAKACQNVLYNAKSARGT